MDNEVFFQRKISVTDLFSSHLTLSLNVWFISNDSLQSCSELNLFGSTLALCPIIHQEEMGVVRVE